MDDRRLREYAFKIYRGDNDYSLQKAFRLFPKYYPKIAFFYTELVSQKQNHLTTRMIQALGIDKADKLKRLSIVASHKKLEMFKLKVSRELNILDLNMLNFDKSDYNADLYISKMYKKQSKILEKVKEMALTDISILKDVEKMAQEYGFNGIILETKWFLKKNTEIYLDICNTVLYYEERTDRFFQYYE